MDLGRETLTDVLYTKVLLHLPQTKKATEYNEKK